MDRKQCNSILRCAFTGTFFVFACLIISQSLATYLQDTLSHIDSYLVVRDAS